MRINQISGVSYTGVQPVLAVQPVSRAGQEQRDPQQGNYNPLSQFIKTEAGIAPRDNQRVEERDSEGNLVHIFILA